MAQYSGFLYCIEILLQNVNNCFRTKEYYNLLPLASLHLLTKGQVKSIDNTWPLINKYDIDKRKEMCCMPASIAFVLPQRQMAGDSCNL